ncbi:hypothetical protein WMF11_46660 [Sorangium sp. So ce295]|uniref:hypothetical protein n=1 Tax=Sorangium sp. So ce295 TaxID=3133295 RepID=UPI003F5DF1A1
MQPRTRDGLVLLLVGVLLGGGVAWLLGRGRESPPAAAPRALDAVPAGAMLVATLDLPALRASPAFASFLREEREIPGLGKVRDVCGFDPVAALTEVAIAIPAAGEGGDFGLVAAGAVQDEALLACASKVIEARGGRPVVSGIGSFRAVRDSSAEGHGEIAVRPGGPILLGGGAYLRAMIDTAEGRAGNVGASAAHDDIARAVGEGAARVTVVLTPEQRAEIGRELALSGSGRSPAASLLSGGASVALGPEIAVHAAVLCDAEAPCAALGAELRAARDTRAADFATRLIGFGAVLERIAIAAEGKALHARVKLSAEEAGVLVDRLASLRGLRQPALPPRRPPAQADSDAPPHAGASAPPARGDAAAPPRGDAAPPPRGDAGVPPRGAAAPPPTDEVVTPPQRAKPDGGAP